VALGEIVGAHGLRGEVRVRHFADEPRHLLGATRLAIGADAEGKGAKEYEVEAARTGRRGEVRFELRGVASREAAQALGGLLVTGDPSELEPLPEGEFYWYQLVGCYVESSDGRRIGTVRAIGETGAHDVLVVVDETGAEVLLPTAGDLLREVDVERGRIVIEVVPGLLDPRPPCGST
jgi:16S rRNA processing protein RimM